MSPSNPFLGGNPATQPNSRGYEAMAMNPKGTHLYAALEGATVAETGSTPAGVRVQRPRRGLHRPRLELPDRAAGVHGGGHVGDRRAPSGRHRARRHRGLDAIFRRAYVVDLRAKPVNGSLVKSLVVDLAAVPDPDLVRFPGSTPATGLGNPFRGLASPSRPSTRRPATSC